MPISIPTDKITVLNAARRRLIDSVDRLSSSTVILSLGDELPAAFRHDQIATLSLAGGRFDDPVLTGGGDQTAVYEGTLTVTLYAGLKTDRVGSDQRFFVDRTRGIFALQHEVLRAFTSHMLRDESDQSLLVEHLHPTSDTDARRTSTQNYGDLQTQFACVFLLDLNETP